MRSDEMVRGVELRAEVTYEWAGHTSGLTTGCGIEQPQSGYCYEHVRCENGENFR